MNAMNQDGLRYFPAASDADSMTAAANKHGATNTGAESNCF